MTETDSSPAPAIASPRPVLPMGASRFRLTGLDEAVIRTLQSVAALRREENSALTREYDAALTLETDAP